MAIDPVCGRSVEENSPHRSKGEDGTVLSAAAMSFSSVSVVTNALRLRRVAL